MFTVFPRNLDQRGLEILVAGFELPGPPPELRLGIKRDGQLWLERQVGPWLSLDGGLSNHIYFCVLKVDLPKKEPAGGQHEITLHGPEGSLLASGSFDELPLELPTSETGRGAHRPFTLWVSSCFHPANAALTLEQTMRAVTSNPALRPHLSLLLGDQIYIDFPQWRTVLTWRMAGLQARFNQAYARSYTNPGFARLLANSASCSLASDHEMWNNYPNSPVALQVRSRRFWDTWRALALERYHALQGGKRLRTLTIGTRQHQLSLMMADTLLDRTSDGLRFMTRPNMQALEDWIDKLECPGILALGHPVITPQGSGVDAHLTDFRQYWDRLLPAFRRSNYDLLVLAGDAHFGRIAETRLNKKGARLIEICSSPLALVSETVASAARLSPREFYASTAPEPTEVTFPQVVPTYKVASRSRTEEHGMTLSFTAPADGQVAVTVRPWLVRHPDTPVPWQWSTRLRVCQD
jgi:hypothetical protein